MSKPTLIYLVMVVVLAGGLWAVLAVGKTLNAPADLAGKWLAHPVEGDAAADMTVEQSGRYFQITLKGHRLDVSQKSETANHLQLTSGKSTLTFDGPLDGNQLTLTVTGDSAGVYIADRLTRRYPVDIKEAR